MQLPTLDNVDLRGKRLVVRADLNVPFEAGRITDTTRIDRFAAGIRPLLARGARLVILTHFGRPDPNEKSPEFSVDKFRPALSAALGVPVTFSDVCADQSAVILSQQLVDGGVLLCENLRLNPGETANDADFAADLARLGDVYVNDAFSCAHRAHASTEGLARLLPAYAGPLMVEETRALTAALEAPKRPSVAIVGGAKVSTKIPVLKNLVGKLDALIIGGGMANTFLFADGHPIGKSLCEPDQIDTVAEIRALARASGCQILLPTDLVCAREFAAGADNRVVPLDGCAADEMILDAGPVSVALFSDALRGAKTILWNGPLGAFEIPPFDAATVALARVAADLTRSGAVTSVAGGGDTVAALNAAGVTGDFTYVSTAGGAFLEWLEGKVLPGIAALAASDKEAA